MKKTKYFASRRETPWDSTLRDNVQEFIRNEYLDDYYEKHPALSESNEANLLNAFVPVCCPNCGSLKFTRKGFTSNGIQRYCCKDCGKRFNILTGTLLDNHKISISEWIEFCLNLFRHDSILSTSANNKNSTTTTAYWTKKLFLLLEDYTEGIVLTGNVYIDETYYNEAASNRTVRNGKELRGISKNKYCIAMGFDGEKVYAFLEGMAKPTRERTRDAFKNHIARGSHLIHDREKSHKVLVEELELSEERYNAREIEKLPDKKNPLAPINRQCFMLKDFLNAHPGFNRKDLQGYLNIFCFMQNPPHDKLKKVEMLLRAIVYSQKTLKYRDAWK